MSICGKQLFVLWFNLCPGLALEVNCGLDLRICHKEGLFWLLSTLSLLLFQFPSNYLLPSLVPRLISVREKRERPGYVNSGIHLQGSFLY